MSIRTIFIPLGKLADNRSKKLIGIVDMFNDLNGYYNVKLEGFSRVFHNIKDIIGYLRGVVDAVLVSFKRFLGELYGVFILIYPPYKLRFLGHNVRTYSYATPDIYNFWFP